MKKITRQTKQVRVLTGRLGGLARAKALTKAQRRAIAQRAARARWAKKKAE